MSSTVNEAGGALGEDVRARADALLARLILTPEGYADPYPIQRSLRELAPVFKSRMGYWVVSRHDDVNEILRSQRVERNLHMFMNGRFGGDWEDHAALRRLGSSLLWSNGADHHRLRTLVNHAFTPRRVEGMRPFVERLTHELLDPLAEAGGGDLLNDFAFPLPITVVATMLGVPRDEAPALRRPIQNFLRTFEMGMTAEDLVEADKGMEFTEAYFTGLIAQRRARPEDDLLSALLEAEAEGGRLSPDELMTFCNTVISAGFESATSMLTNLVLHLWQDRSVLERLRADPSLVPGAVDEVLRFDPPVHLVPRMTFEPVRLGDVTIPAGETVVVMLASANRDPAKFADPDVLDIERENNPHLAFSAGMHHCLGWSLAKLEAVSVMNALLARFSRIEILEKPVYRTRMTIRSMESLRVALVPR